MSWTRIIAPEVPELPVFAHAAVAGDTIYVSGMLGVNDDFSGARRRRHRRGDDPGVPARGAHPRGGGATIADIVKVSVYMPDLANGTR